jgi:hypothetical protein
MHEQKVARVFESDALALDQATRVLECPHRCALESAPKSYSLGVGITPALLPLFDLVVSKCVVGAG